MSSKHLKVGFSLPHQISFSPCRYFNNPIVIARSALAQEEAEEFSGEFSDPINIHLENDRDGCAC